MSNSEEHSSTKESVQVLLQEAWKLVGSLGESRSDNTLGSPWLVNQQWKYFRDASSRLVERSHNQNLGVAVVALTKSGGFLEWGWCIVCTFSKGCCSSVVSNAIACHGSTPR